MNHERLRRAIASSSLAIAIAATLIVGPIGGGPATAEPRLTSRFATEKDDQQIDKIVPGHFKHKLTRTSSVRSTNFAKSLTSCGASGPGVGCSISRSISADVAIGVTMGMTRNWIAAQLGVTASTSITYTVSCNTTTALRSGQRLYAYPYGTRYYYKVDRYVVKNKIISSARSTAFVPQKGQVTCRIR